MLRLLGLVLVFALLPVKSGTAATTDFKLQILPQPCTYDVVDGGSQLTRYYSPEQCIPKEEPGATGDTTVNAPVVTADAEVPTPQSPPLFHNFNFDINLAFIGKMLAAVLALLLVLRRVLL